MVQPLRFVLLVLTGVWCASCASPPTRITQVSDAPAPSIEPAVQPGVHSPALESTSLDAAALGIRREHWQFSVSNEETVNGAIIHTPNYKLYTTITYEHILDRLPVFYELALKHYTSALAVLPQPSEPLESYVFQHRNQWLAMTQKLLPDQADMFSTLGRGGFTTRGMSVLYYIDYYGYTRDTFAIAAHEGWHQYTQQTFRQQLPVWIEEGIATYMEGYRTVEGVPTFQPSNNRERRDELRRAIRDGQLISLDDLLRGTPQSSLNSGKNRLLVYYAQVWGLTRFLAEGENGKYAAALSRLLTDAAEGRLHAEVARHSNSGTSGRRGSAWASRMGKAVMETYFNPDLRALEGEYLRFINDITQRSNGPRG